ncbi:MAG: methyl-accepting chemotaxis protein [Methanoregulaceae archaeon]|nr:methyl-accepting chemotaxis protein [Methanoregulaceae archaeon]
MVSLNDMKIGTKLIAGYLIVVAILGIVAWIGFSNMQTMAADEAKIAVGASHLDTLGNMDAGFYKLRGDVYLYIISPATRDTMQTTIDQDVVKVNSYVDELKKADLDTAERAELTTYEGAWAGYQKLASDVMDKIKANDEKGGLEQILSSGATATRAAVTDSNARLSEMNTKEMQALTAQGAANAATASTTIIIALIIGVVAALSLGLYLSRSISKPIGITTEMIQDMSNGKLDRRLKLTRKDEVGVMAEAMDQCCDVLQSLKDETVSLANDATEGKLTSRGNTDKFQGGYKEIVIGINKTLDHVIGPLNEAMRISTHYAKGDFTARMDDRIILKGDFIEFRKALDNIGIEVSKSISMIKNQMADLAASAEEANASIEEVASGSNQVAKSASVVSSNAERSGNGINQVLKAMEDLSKTVTEVASQTEQVSALLANANNLSKKGAQLAQKAESGMAGITTSSAHAEKIIIEIREQMDQIGKIVDLISDLANQTNLLALNAAIEAARAGDAGRGFAVVATEVKSLAQESQTSAENIAQMISNLQNKSQEAAESMSGATTSVKEGSSALSETLGVFKEIVIAVDQVANNLTQVASATEEQAASTEEITASVSEVGGLMQATVKESMDSAAASEESSAAIDQITKVVGNVNVIVEKVSREVSNFKV